MELAQHFGFTANAITYTPSDGVLVCGSPFERSNKDDDNSPTNSLGSFDSGTPEAQRTTEGDDFVRQKKITWTHLALQARDQLRPARRMGPLADSSGESPQSRGCRTHVQIQRLRFLCKCWSSEQAFG